MRRSGVRIPLSPPQKYRTNVRYFLCGIGAFHDFIVVLLCNMNPYGLTLSYYGSVQVASYESPYLHQKEHKSNPVRLVLFLWGNKWIVRFFKNRTTVSPCEPLRADNKRRETQARSICGHRVQSHSQQIRHEVSAKGAVQRTIYAQRSEQVHSLRYYGSVQVASYESLVSSTKVVLARLYIKGGILTSV